MQSQAAEQRLSDVSHGELVLSADAYPEALSQLTRARLGLLHFHELVPLHPPDADGGSLPPSALRNL